MTLPLVVVAPDKFRGTATAQEAAAAMAAGARRAGWRAVELPMADGGEGTLDALGGANRSTIVPGPLGTPVVAPWRLDGETAVVEAAYANGLALVGGAAGNDAVRASSAGVGVLIRAAVDAGARTVCITLGGSATTDGGRGAIDALGVLPDGVELVVACDVDTAFVDASRVFAPQKGANAEQVLFLTDRLQGHADQYRADYGVDVTSLRGAGAAGGLAGGLAVLGARLVRGAELVAAQLGLAELVEGADLVLTGEGKLDLPSFAGKTVGAVTDLARAAGVRTVAIVGIADTDAAARIDTVTLTDTYGATAAFSDTLKCLERAAFELVQATQVGPQRQREESTTAKALL